MPRMPRISTRGPSGVATLLEGKKNDNQGRKRPVVQVKFEDGSTYYVYKTKDTVPSYVQNGTFFVSLNQSKNKIESMRPVSGTMRGKVKNFVAREGEQPVPRTRQGQYGPYEVFSVILQVTKPEKYAGMEVYLEMPFKFVSTTVTVNGENHEVLAIPISKSKSVEMLDNFVLATKATAKQHIPYSDNPLPTMEKRILRAEAEFDWTMKDGWVSDILPPDLNEDFGSTPAEESTTDFSEPEEAEEFVEDFETETPSEEFGDDEAPDWGSVED